MRKLSGVFYTGVSMQTGWREDLCQDVDLTAAAVQKCHTARRQGLLRAALEAAAAACRRGGMWGAACRTTGPSV